MIEPADFVQIEKTSYEVKFLWIIDWILSHSGLWPSMGREFIYSSLCSIERELSVIDRLLSSPEDHLQNNIIMEPQFDQQELMVRQIERIVNIQPERQGKSV